MAAPWREGSQRAPSPGIRAQPSANGTLADRLPRGTSPTTTLPLTPTGLLMELGYVWGAIPERTQCELGQEIAGPSGKSCRGSRVSDASLRPCSASSTCSSPRARTGSPMNLAQSNEKKFALPPKSSLPLWLSEKDRGGWPQCLHRGRIPKVRRLEERRYVSHLGSEFLLD
jgi:hypothetical protein